MLRDDGSGFVMASSPCFCCHWQFSFNPNKVPSFRDPKTGKREPICGPCMASANADRVKLGLPPHPIDPEAYQPIPASEI